MPEPFFFFFFVPPDENLRDTDEAEILTSEVHDPYARTTGA